MRKPFLTFLAILTVLLASAIWFIQSAQFAQVFKAAVAKYLPADLGVDLDFTEFAIKLYPPGLSLKNPEAVLRKHNIFKLPSGSTVMAERIDFSFLPFQVFTGKVRVHEITVVKGDIKLILDEATLNGKTATARKSGSRFEFHWDELLQVRAEAVALEDTKFRLEVAGTDRKLEFLARSARMAQWSGKGGLGYELKVEVSEFHQHGFIQDLPPVAESLDKLAAGMHLNALGAQIDFFEVSTQGLAAKASGLIKGDLLNPKSLVLDGALSLQGDIQKLSPLLGPVPGKAKGSAALPAQLPELGGEIDFQGKVKGNLERLMETLRAEGRIVVKSPRFRQWEADSLQAEGSWVASSRGGEIILSHAVVTAQERPRVTLGPRQAGGRGGRVEINDLRVNLGQSEPIHLSARLERAHLHWLAAMALKDVFPIDLRASGPLEATFTPASAKQPWALQAKLGLKVEEFQLDNQKLGQFRPLHRVLKVPLIKVDGGVSVDPSGLRPDGLTLELPNSKFRMAGKIDFKNGYDLFGGGSTKLEDIGEIAGNQIRGDGSLSVHVHGPMSSVLLDFDVDMQDAYYLHLKFGAFRGRITWEDGPNHLVFRKLELLKGRTPYTGEGMLDLGKADSVAINVKIPDGNIADLTGIFEETVSKISWFPRSLTGAVGGEVQVTGGISMDKLDILANLTGSGWEYAGERLESVNLQGGYEKGRYHVSTFRGVKRAGRMMGHIWLDPAQNLDWELKTQGLSVSDLDHVAGLDVPIRGHLNVESSGRGPIGAINSLTKIGLTDLAVRGVPMAPSQFQMKSAAGLTEIRVTGLGGQGNLEVNYDAHEGAASSLKGEMKHLDYSPVLLLLNPKAIPDTSIVGAISGAINLNFRSGEIDRSNGSVEITEYLLEKTGTRFRLAHPISFRVVDGSFDVRDLSLIGNGHEARLAIRSRKAALDGKISGEVDLSFLEFLTSSVSKASGAAELDFSLAGTIKAPLFTGKASIDSASLRVPSVESPIENITGGFVVKQNAVTVRGLEGELAGGRVTVNGGITLFADRYPEIALKGLLSGNRLKVYPFQYVKAQGSVNITGTQPPYLIAGDINVDSALSREKVYQQKAGPTLKTALYTPPPSARRMSDYPKFRLKIGVKADGGILVQNELFDMEAKAELTLVNTLEAPRILGTVEVVQGKMLFKDRSFRIQSATAEFDSPTVLNPRFNLTSLTEVSGVKVQLFAQGRLDKIAVELTSQPAMSEPEILSLLNLGLTGAETRRMSSGDRSVVEQGEAASLLLHSLDFNREVESKTGVQIQLDESVNSQLGTSIFRAQSPNESAAAPRIVIRKRINKNVDLSVGSTVGVGTGSQKEVNAEVKVTPGFSVNGVYDYLESDTAEGTRTSFGLDLKLQKRFK